MAGRNSREFWCPGSTLKAVFDNAHPLAYGMPPEGLALYLGGSPAFEILPTEHNERYQVVARYADRDLLASGWLLDGQVLANKAAQTHATFKLILNALVR